MRLLLCVITMSIQPSVVKFIGYHRCLCLRQCVFPSCDFTLIQDLVTSQISSIVGIQAGFTCQFLAGPILSSGLLPCHPHHLQHHQRFIAFAAVQGSLSFSALSQMCGQGSTQQSACMCAVQRNNLPNKQNSFLISRWIFVLILAS